MLTLEALGFGVPRPSLYMCQKAPGQGVPHLKELFFIEEKALTVRDLLSTLASLS